MRKPAAFLAALLLPVVLYAGASRNWADAASSRYIDISGSSNSALAGWSVAAWVFPDAGINSSEVILQCAGVNAVYSTQSSGDKLTYYNGVAVQTSTGTLIESTWNHIVVSRGPSTTIAMYLNGTAVHAAADAVSLPAPDMIGFLSLAAHRWTGHIADVRIYDRALTAAEVATAAGGIAAPNPYCWWPLWDASTQAQLGTESLCADGTNVSTAESSAGPPISLAAGALP